AIQLAASAGFRGYEPWVEQFNGVDIPHFVKLARRSRLELLPLMGIHGFFVQPPGQQKRELVYALAKELGIREVTLVPGEVGGKIVAIERDRAYCDILEEIMIASRYGIRLICEMVAFPRRPFNTLSEAMELARRTGVKLVLDTFHLAVSQASLEEIRLVPKSLIGLVHLSDAIMTGRTNPADLVDEDRVLPGEGALPLRDILQVLGETGYQGYVSVEVFHPKYAVMDPEKLVKEAYVRAKSILEDSGWHVEL
ncbi:MAG: sugar phosphate isomerase/epimerase family protein, partial [Candidatus Hadarchaeum sp.]|uniref:sugar phosphate isomerase/epimerase family protein n=1 Tax=Candidatus Hadarchaeum sp. TaxID=2883567 RepID=UPI00316DD98B